MLGRRMAWGFEGTGREQNSNLNKCQFELCHKIFAKKKKRKSEHFLRSPCCRIKFLLQRGEGERLNSKPIKSMRKKPHWELGVGICYV